MMATMLPGQHCGRDDYGWFRQVQTWDGDGVALLEEHDEFVAHPWHHTVNESYGIGLVRYGAYRRRSRGIDAVVDANVGFLRFASEEVAVASFTGEPREVTYITVDAALTDGLFDAPSDDAAFHVTPEIELNHQRLLLARRAGADDLTMQHLAFDVLERAFGQHRGAPRTYSRRSTARARRQLVTDACEVLHTSRRDISLVELAATVGCSPFHLSRVFHEIAGMTIPRYRRQLRVHDAVNHIAAGATDLAAIAAVVGFADHSHMTRSIVARFDTTPSRLRELLREPCRDSALRPVASD